jgi:hypothetical protein
VTQVFEAVVNWKNEFNIAGVLQTDIDRFREIDTRLRKN